MSLLLEKKLKDLPESPGVYIYKDRYGKIIYVGKAINLKNRVKSYFSRSLNLGEKTRKLVENISNLDLIKVDSEVEALLLEANLIQKYKPKYNIELKDNRAYPLLKITINEKYPRISKTRTIENDKAKYFGPYTDVNTLNYILRELRKMFLFRTCRVLPKKPCLYYYIGKCQAPCIFTTKNQEIEYKKYIKNVILFLEGKKDLLIKELLNQQNNAIKEENFEKAGEIKNQIEKIKDLTKPSIKPFEYLKNPNLIEDQIEQSLQGLKEVLNKYFISIQNLNRIECYDIATVQGKFSTGSMIVFTNGTKNTNEYRRFKIHKEGKPNDYEMLREVLNRRFTHQEWQTPDLLVIDGGKGQLSTGEEVLKELQQDIPIIALAKREEEIYIRDDKLNLNKSSNALKLLQRIRDEAHRFATTYHKKLRQSALTRGN